MSQENVETFRRHVAWANSQGPDAIDQVAALYHPDAEARDLQPGPGMPEAMQGRAEIVASWRQWLEVLDNWSLEVRELVDADPWVISDSHWHAVGKGSDVPIDWRVVEAYEFKNGQIVRAVFGFSDVAAAVEAVGLSEQEAHADSS